MGSPGRPKGTKKDEVIRYLSEDEIFRFFKAIEKSKTKVRDGLLFSLTMYLGLRLGEVQKIQLTDINLDSFQIVIKGLKSGNTRSYDLPGKITRRLKRWLSLREKEPESKMNPYLFPSSLYHDEPINRNTLAWLFRKYAKRAKISEDLSFHSLRHTCAISLAMNNWSGIKIKNWLRHKSILSTGKYIELVQFKEDEREASGLFNKYL